KAMWFRGSYLRDKFHVGQMVALYGKLEPSRSNAGKFKMIQPQFEILPSHGGPDAEFSMLEVGRIVPAYGSLDVRTAWGQELELGLELKRRRMREREGTACATNVKVREAIKQVLPFHPTAAQKRVLGEIATDMRKPQPMRRLLQGDVGSGKTIVAMQAAVVAI